MSVAVCLNLYTWHTAVALHRSRQVLFIAPSACCLLQLQKGRRQDIWFSCYGGCRDGELRHVEGENARQLVQKSVRGGNILYSN